MTQLLSTVGEAGRTWRDVEGQLFRLVADMVDGNLPDLDELAPADVRRVGYLAEMAALLLDVNDPGSLLSLAARARHLLAGSAMDPPIPLVPGSAAVRGRRADSLAVEWGVAHGFDVARYVAEIPVIRLEMEVGTSSKTGI